MQRTLSNLVALTGALAGSGLVIGSLVLPWVCQETTRWSVGSEYWKMLGPAWLVGALVLTLAGVAAKSNGSPWLASSSLAIGAYNAIILSQRLQHYREISKGEVTFTLGIGAYLYAAGAVILWATSMLRKHSSGAT